MCRKKCGNTHIRLHIYIYILTYVYMYLRTSARYRRFQRIYMHKLCIEHFRKFPSLMLHSITQTYSCMHIYIHTDRHIQVYNTYIYTFLFILYCSCFIFLNDWWWHGSEERNNNGGSSSSSSTSSGEDQQFKIMPTQCSCANFVTFAFRCLGNFTAKRIK